MAGVALTLAGLLATAAVSPSPPTPDMILAAAPAGDWAQIDPASLLVIDLAGGGQVVIALADAFAPVHIANIRALARAGWYDGQTAIVRVQDNYVTQWGDPGNMRAMPAGIVDPAPAEYERDAAGLDLVPLPYRDPYAKTVGYVAGFPVASDGRRAWATHCYGMVGIARDVNPSTGTGAELYAVIGQSPRGLDRNIAIAGRVVAGMEHLSALPRGAGKLGFYTEAGQRTAIIHVRVAADMPVATRPALEWLRPDSATWRAWSTLRANRHDAFFLRPAGAVDLCGAMPPVRAIER